MSELDPRSTKKTLPTPQNHRIFDPWNSSSSGHQLADTSTGTSWRRTREEKLARQFKSTSADCRDSASDVGPNNEEKGEWVWSHINQGEIRDSRQRDIRSMMRVGKRLRSSEDGSDLGFEKDSLERKQKVAKVSDSQIGEKRDVDHYSDKSSLSLEMKEVPQIFKGVTVYINSTYHPLVSDHYLKQLLMTHGATISLSPSKKVSHIIVGKPNSGPGKGAGGGLAASKLQKEISRGGWKGFKVVFTEWVLESIEAGRRLSEAKFAMNIMPKGQRRVLSFTRV